MEKLPATLKRYLTNIKDNHQLAKPIERIQLPVINELMKQDSGAVKARLELEIALANDVQGYSVTDHVMSVQADAILEEYKFNNLDSILTAIRNGGRGKYGKTFGKIGMDEYSHWIGQVLEDDAQARESIHHNRKDHTEYAHVDYEVYRQRVKDEQTVRSKARNVVNVMTPEEREKRAKELVEKLGLE